MKENLDRDGVNYLENEAEMGRQEGQNTTPSLGHAPRGIGPSRESVAPLMPEYGRP
jgi:hypothetical protein